MTLPSTHKQRNVLLITADQWRGDCLSAVGHPVVRSPHLDALAAEGVLFERHFANAVPCGPSRACLHTGMYLHNHRSGTNGTPLDRRFTNWALELRRAGYDPALFGYTHTAPDPRYMTSDDPRLGTDEGILPGITPVVDMATHCGPWRDWLKQFGYRIARRSRRDVWAARCGPQRRRGAATIAVFARSHRYAFSRAERDGFHYGNARGDGSGRPGLAKRAGMGGASVGARAASAVGSRAALQRALSAAAHCRRRCVATTSTAESELHPWLAAQLHSERHASHADDLRHRMLQASYYGLMSEVDDNMGRLFAHLKSLGQWDDTLIVFTSDHGEQMGDHWQYGKAGFFDQSYHIPMIVRDPNGVKQGRVAAFTEHVDVMPTILEWLGLEVPRQCDGRSLQSFLHGRAAPEDWRTEAHWEYDFRDSGYEQALGLTLETCSLNVVRGARYEIRALRRSAAAAVRPAQRSGRAGRSRAG